ncbi:hypothetical protein [Rhodoblastus sp.]|uniref:hypothetical protein n=1 Tax=Rhodoblastus sp. TaxID=1962975 RepID=UPI003F9703C8
MSKAGAYLSGMSILGMFCFSSGGRAENLLEMIFGHLKAPVESHQNSASPSRRNGHHSFKSDRFAWRKHSGHEASARGDDSTPSPASMKLSYAEVWGVNASGLESARDMIAKVSEGDSTLRRGDAFMTSEGLQVFVGDRNGDTKFVPVEAAPQISRALKAQLKALEKSPAAKPVRVARVKSRVDSASGAPVTTSKPEKATTQVVKDRLIETPNGKIIRLVGGYAG